MISIALNIQGDSRAIEKRIKFGGKLSLEFILKEKFDLMAESSSKREFAIHFTSYIFNIAVLNIEGNHNTARQYNIRLSRLYAWKKIHNFERKSCDCENFLCDHGHKYYHGNAV